MAANLFKQIVGLLCGLTGDIVDQLGDATSRSAMLARAGLADPGAGPDGQPVASAMDALRAKAATADADAIAVIQEFGAAMTDVVAFVQQTSGVNNLDDAWNLVATYLDLVSVDRLREKNPEALAVLNTLHLISDDRLLFADLIRAGSNWGKFLLGEPVTDSAKQSADGDGDAEAAARARLQKLDNLSLIFGAAMVLTGKFIPLEDADGKQWRLDALFGWDPEPHPVLPHTVEVLKRVFTLRFQPFNTGDTVEGDFGLSGVIVPPADGGWGLYLGLDVGGQLSFPVGENLELVFVTDSPDAVEAFFGDPPFVRSGVAHTNAQILLRRKQQIADHWTIGTDKGVHLEIDRFKTGLQLIDPPAFVFSVDGGALVIPQDAIGFLKSVLPTGGMTFDFGVDLQLDTTGKLSLSGQAGMTVTVPADANLGILNVRSVMIALELAGDKDKATAAASLAVTAAFSVKFGKAFIVTIDGIGAALKWTLPSSPAPLGTVEITHGNLGAAGNLTFDFVVPKGVGIQIGVDPVTGGGFLFFDPAHHSYGGVLDAEIALCGKGIVIKAAGLLRDTDDGYDFVLIMSAQLIPAPQILGLQISGIGGMVGINVAVDIDKLRAGVHDGAISRLLFPDDPLANAPAIIATISAMFPHRKDGYVAGLLLQLGWGDPEPFITLSLGIVVAFPHPTLLMLLGSLRMAVPTKDLRVLHIRVDFLGVVDFGPPTYSLDGSLVDSRLGAFPLTGDMAGRAGKQAHILSFGGYHPKYVPEQPLPQLKRLTVDLSPTPLVKIKAEAYIAVTSNSFQLGLHASLDIVAAVATLHGWAEFDVLVQWKPKFFFSARLALGVEVRVGGSSWAGIAFEGVLQGPGPWHFDGQASLHLLFFTLHIPVHPPPWGEDDATPLPPQVDAAAVVAEQLLADGAWAGVAPDGGSPVTVKPGETPAVRLHPDGQLTVRQQAVPIGVPITRVGRSPVVGGTTTVVLTPGGGVLACAPSIGQFAASEFIDLTDDEKLSRPSFEPYQDGLTFGPTQVVMSADELTIASYETVFVPDQPKPPPTALSTLLLTHGLSLGAVARSGLHVDTLNDGPDQHVTLSDPGYRLVSVGTLTPAAAAPQTFGSAAAAFAAANNLGGAVIVVDAHEVSG